MKNKVNILGTEYEILKQSAKDNEMFEKLDCSGYCDWTSRRIHIRDYLIDTETFGYSDCEIHMNKTLRHEIVHIFLYESGLWANSTERTCGWAMNEEMVDWIAIQAPKIFKVYNELEIL